MDHDSSHHENEPRSENRNDHLRRAKTHIRRLENQLRNARRDVQDRRRPRSPSGPGRRTSSSKKQKSRKSVLTREFVPYSERKRITSVDSDFARRFFETPDSIVTSRYILIITQNQIPELAFTRFTDTVVSHCGVKASKIGYAS